MTPLWKQRVETQPAGNPWKVSDRRTRFPKCPNAAPRHSLPSYTFGSKSLKHPTVYKSLEIAGTNLYRLEEPVLQRVNGYHGRHAEASPVRPRIVTVVRPSEEHGLRKISLLLNRRAVQTFELLLADVSEALGFPSWSNGRVRRLFSPAGREICSLSDFFHFDHAFLAFGKSRPTLGDIQAALEELYPDSQGYHEHLLQIWERMLRPKATKADSGFHDDDPQINSSLNEPPDPQVTQPAANNLQPIRTHVKQKDRVRRERPRGEWEHWKGNLQAQIKAENADKKKESVYCRTCRGAGAPIPSIGSKQCAKPEGPKNQSKAAASQASRTKNPSLQHQEPEAQPDILNQISETKAIQNPSKVLILETWTETPAEQDKPKAERVEQRDWEHKLLPDGAKVSLEEIERCYDIGCVVGDGNFAVVRECRVRGSPQTFAMKIVDKAKLQGRGHMIQNEISLLCSLAHPRLVQLLRSHHTDSHVYLLMELVTGGDLFDAIAQSGRFSESCTARMIRDISQALEYIHNKSIAHRDIKPENLLVQRHSNGSVNLKLADFGLAMVVTEPVFTVCGTPTYVAPEILAETGYGVAVDVWAMGVILFVLLSGFPPFRSPDRNQEELFRLIQKGEVHFLSPYWDPVSEGAKALIRALLEVNPAVRLTASQTLQNRWLQHAVSQSDHMVETQTINKKDQLKPSRNPLGLKTQESPLQERAHMQELSAQQADVHQSTAKDFDLHSQEKQSHHTNTTNSTNHNTNQEASEKSAIRKADQNPDPEQTRKVM
ncbi:serine/threonine-protein kinase DCLK3 [Hoplias malabaricus]|uniref:serine/threonine-protein kinase DCLK3 n=1 Tax=Hoplias malabaricus TaxID=27720 RepID=UPI003461A0E2